MSRRTSTIVLTVILALVTLGPAEAELRLSRLISDGMVLQREVPTAIWGWTDDTGEILLTFDGRDFKTKPDEEGRWKVTLPSRDAGGPFEMSVRSGEERLEISDIWVGDVWLCSGQSNMEWSVALSQNAEAEIAAANDPAIRHFKIPHSFADTPEDTLAGGVWEKASSETVGDFTAVGYYFARELRRHVNVPIGLINSSWGGSRIEPWMHAQALGFGENENAMQIIEERRRADAAARLEKLKDILGSVPTEDAGLVNDKALWADPGLNDKDWRRMTLPTIWESEALPGLNGIVWFRKHIHLTAAEATAVKAVGVGQIDDSDMTWVNGQKVGGLEMSYNTPRLYPVAPGLFKEGKNVITVRVEDTGGGGGIWGPSEQLHLDLGEQRSLAGEWLFKVGAFIDYPQSDANQVPTILYNKMIHPILKYPIRGALWYQGESNTARADAFKYRDLFATMIEDWRQRWDNEFPFLFVQLASFMAPPTEPSNSNWATLRESQATALSLPKTAQAVTVDIGDAEDVHPRNKQDVGLRLALAARRIVYGEDIVYSGPTYRDHEVRDGRVVLSFDHAGGGLVAKGGTPTQLAVAGDDRQFVWAQGKIDGNRLVVWSPDVPKPVAVRYAWAANPEGANLYNTEGLPASPFRTDDW